MLSVVLLILIAGLAVLMLRWVDRAARTIAERGIAAGAAHLSGLFDVGLPAAAVLPFAVLGAFMHAKGAGMSVATVSAPLCLGAAGLGAGLAIARQPIAISPLALLLLAACSLALLLLAWLGTLSIGVGQSFFAAGIVLMWVNMPDAPPRKESRDAAALRESVPSAAPIVIVAICQCVCIAGCDAAWHGVILGLLAMQVAVVAVVLAARESGAQYVARCGGWMCIYAALLCVGTISFSEVLRAAIRARAGNPQLALAAAHGVARNLSGVAWDAALLLLAMTTAAIARGSDQSLRRIVGGMLAVAAAGVLVFRLLTPGTV